MRNDPPRGARRPGGGDGRPARAGPDCPGPQAPSRPRAGPPAPGPGVPVPPAGHSCPTRRGRSWPESPANARVTHGIAVATGLAVGRYEVLEDVAIADCALESRAGTSTISSRRRPALWSSSWSIRRPWRVGRAADHARGRHGRPPVLRLAVGAHLPEGPHRQVFPQTEVRVSGDGPVRLEADVRGGVIDRAARPCGPTPRR